MESLDSALEEAIKEISTNHHKIIDDWCKAYLAQLYGLGLEIYPGCFTLNQMPFYEGTQAGYKYWFTLKGSDMPEETFIEANIREMFEASCKVILEKKLDDAEFNLCKNTIQTTLTYLSMKRAKNQKEPPEE